MKMENIEKKKKNEETRRCSKKIDENEDNPRK